MCSPYSRRCTDRYFAMNEFNSGAQIRALVQWRDQKPKSFARLNGGQSGHRTACCGDDAPRAAYRSVAPVRELKTPIEPSRFTDISR
jgi:hypothetical protein